MLKAEKFFFYLLVFFLSFQTRHIFYQWGQYFNEWNAGYLYATDILILALIFFWLVRGLDVKFKKTEAALVVFLILSGLSLISAKNFWLGAYGWVKLAEFSLLFLYVKYNFAAFYSLGKFFAVFAASAILQSVIAIGQFIKQGSLGLKFLTESPLAPNIAAMAKIDLGGQKIIRAYGLTPHPNILAAILMLAIFGLAFLLVNNYKNMRRYQKIAGSAGLVALSAALFFTFSRAVAAIGFAFFLLWLAKLWRQKEYKKPAVIIFLLFAVCYSLLAIFYWSYFSARYNPENLSGSQALDLRVFYNEVAIKLIKQSPFLGVGQGNFTVAFNDYQVIGKYYAQFQTWMFQPAHNVYLLIAAEVGILGLIYFLLFLLAIWQQTKKSSPPQPADCLFYLFCFIIISALFDHFFWTLQQGQIIFWLFLGILMSMSLSPRSLTDKASPSGGEDCAFNSHQGHLY